jgi:hypothetical protein
MRVVVVYESMFGNTRQIGQAIADGIGESHEVAVVPVQDATPALISDADLVVVGGPTHIHGMSRPSSRKSAGEIARKPDSDVVLEPGAEGPGLREWFASLDSIDAYAAAFDTRIPGPPILMGQASKRIYRLLNQHGARRVFGRQSFLVTKNNTLKPAEIERARSWGEELMQLATSSAGTGSGV